MADVTPGAAPAATTLHTHAPHSIAWHFNPARMLRLLWQHRDLTVLLAKREVETRYKAHTLGLLWAVVTPLLLLATYTFVFAVIFKARWSADDAQQTTGGMGLFALNVFAGLLVFGVFREIVARAPGLVIGNRAYVKRIVFPLESLTVADLLVALFTFTINAAVWLLGWVVITGSPPHPQALLLPLLMLPVCLAALGIGWFLSALGTFIRDLQNVVELALTVLLFLTPIFYSLDAVPAPYDALVRANPIAEVIEAVRAAALRGQWPDAARLAVATGISALIALFGFGVFSKARRAFADVL